MNVLQFAETRRLYARLLAQVWPYRWQFGVAVIGMVLTAATEPALVQGDRQQLDQVIRNLIDNSLKYANPSQPVELAVSHVNGDDSLRNSCQ